MRYAFSRKIDITPLAKGTGGYAETWDKPGCIWDGASGIEKGLMVGGLLVAVGSVGLAFLGPAKLMTTYLIASAIGSGTSVVSYVYAGSKIEACETDSLDAVNFEAVCNDAFSKMTPTEKALYKATKQTADDLVASGSTADVDQGFRNLVAQFSAGSPAAKQFAKCIDTELKAGT